MRLPINFLYLGGDKCGSTWVHHILSQHPQVTLAKAKELFYFDRFYERGPEWYCSQFPSTSSALRVGEICHDYLYSEQALTRIAKDLPADSRFIIITRNPTDRTISHHRYLIKIGRTNLPFEASLSASPQILTHSMFGKNVRQAQKILGAQRIYVLSFEDLKRDPVQFGYQLCHALGIQFIPNLPYKDRILEAQAARNPRLVRLLRDLGWVARRVGAPQLVSRVKSNRAINKVLYQETGRAPKFEVSPELRSRLRDHFAEDQELLQQCLVKNPLCVAA